MTHKAFLVAETMVLADKMQAALEHLGAPDWLWKQADTISSGELLVEFMGRLCYKSFEVGLNPNVTKVREGNDVYLGNVLRQKHGSVFEHATVTFALLDVSRIFTHELVRHRAGTAYSQESQRFVRLDNFSLYIPDLTDALTALAPAQPTLERPEDSAPVLVDQETWVQHYQDSFVKMADRISASVRDELVAWMREIGIDEDGVPFHVKKELTSAMRRLIPGGVNTNIGITANHRTWRHLIANRTAVGAEVEIREVFYDIACQLKERYGNIYQDMQIITNDNGDILKIPRVEFLNEKI
jgi:thymidylate synthase (FAD)